MTLFALIDCNNFYVSCERIFRPDLLKKPVAVLSNNDGCFISRSNEVKALGIPMGAPLFKYKYLIDQHNVTVFSANFAFYGDISSRIMHLISEIVPACEVYSIDEVFVDLTDVDSPKDTAHHIRQQVLKCVGIPTCVGVGPTQTFAKVANYLAKKRSVYNGVCILEDPQDIEEALKNLPIKEIWGIGRRLSLRLKQVGINTAYDLKKVDPRWMRQHFTVVGERLVQELNGLSCLSLEEQPEPKKSIQVSRSFANDVTEFDELRANLASYATRLGVKLREQGLKTTTLIIYIKTNRFKEGFYQASQVVNLPQAVNDDANLIKACGKALEQIFKPNLLYKKAGIMALELLPASAEQYSLFKEDKISSNKTEKLSEALDKINKKYGRGTIHSAACGIQLTWKDRKEFKSLSYTTSWSELPIVYAR